MKIKWIIAALFVTGLFAEASVPSSEISLLFVQNSLGMSFDSGAGTLTLEKVSPTVTFFSDRPERVAGHVLLSAFVDVWGEGADSFAEDPPNATLSIFDGKDVRSVIIELADPSISDDRLTYTVVRVLDGELPASGGSCSLFIDGLLSGGVKGAAGGALIGAIAGDAGKGAAIGAGIGAVGGGIHKHRQDEAAAAADAQAADEASKTRVINVPNANGSFTPVTVHLVPNGWQGPKGEIYPTLPTPEQLAGSYGMK